MWTCSSCAGRNPSGTRFCGHCGAPAARHELGLGGRPDADVAATVTEVAGLAATRRDEERRLVTVLFADVSGFTTLADRFDPDQLAEIVDPVLQTMGAIVAAHGGRVGKYAGDAVLAFFGAPVAHEDDAIRALRAASDMRREVKRLARSFPAGARDLSLHIGVNSGYVVAGFLGDDESLDYSVLGDTVNTAQRLEAAAPSGEIYVGELTHELARRSLPFEDIGELVLKGKPKPVRAWRVAADRVEVGADARSGVLVGRAREVAVLRSTLESIASGTARVVALVGEPGVGKSRLLEQMRRDSPAAGTRWVQTRCLSYGTGAYGPYVELLRTLTGASEEDSEVVATQGSAPTPAGDTAAYLQHLLGLETETSIPSGIFANPESLRLRVNEAMVEFLRELAAEGPLVIAIEDVQWMDAASADLTGLVAGRCRTLPLCIAVTSRPEGRSTVERIGEGLGRPVDVFELARLEPESVAALVKDTLGPPADELLAFLVERTGGNPLYVQEVVRALLDAGALTRSRSGWSIGDPQAAERVPTTLESVLAARIDMLPRDAAEVLQIASVIGRRVPLALLATVAPSDSLERHVDLLVERELLDRVEDAPEPSVVFHHALVVDVAYGRLLGRPRRELHRRLFEVARRLYGEGDDVIDLLAHHARRAELGAAAIPYLAGAGRRAARMFANEQASAYLEDAIAIAERDPAVEPGLPSLLVELANVEELTGKFGSALAHYERARSLAGDLRAFCGQASTLRKLGRYDESLQVLDDAATEHPDPRGRDRVQLAILRGNVLFPRGGFRLAEDAMTAVLADASEIGGAVEAELLLELARVKQSLAKHEDAMKHGERSVALFEELGDRARLARALRVLGGGIGDSHEDVDGKTRAIHVLERAVTVARQAGNVEDEAAALMNLGRIVAEIGRAEEALQYDHDAIAAFGRIGIKAGVANAYCNLADKLRDLGRIDESRVAAEAALAVAEEIGHGVWKAGALGGLGEACFLQGDYARAVSYCERSLAIYTELGDVGHLDWMRPLLADARAALQAVTTSVGER